MENAKFRNTLLLFGALMMSGCSLDEEEAIVQETPVKQTVSIAAGPSSESILEETGWNKEAFKSFINVLPDGRAWIPLGIDVKGTLIGSVPAQFNQPYQMVLFDSTTGTHDIITTLSTEGAQCAGADINEKYVVWSEALDQTFMNWKLHVYNRTTGQDRILYKSHKDSNGNGFSGPLWIPDLEGDEIVFSPAVGPMTEHGHNIKALKISVVSDQITELAAPAGNPQLKKDFALWVGRDTATGAPELFWNRGGRTHQLTKDQRPAYFASDGGTSFAWSNFEDYKWHVRLNENGEVREIATSENQMEPLQFVRMGERILSWISTTNTQVYDRKLGKILTLDQTPAIDVYTSGKYLYWTHQMKSTGQNEKVGKVTLTLVDLDQI